MPFSTLKRWDWREGLRWFGAEFLVVVTGVLVALAVGAWWQGRQNGDTERAYLRQLAADLRETERAALEADAFLRPIDRAGSLLWLAFYQAPPPPDSLLVWAERSMWTATVRPVLGTAEALVATGDLALVRDDALRTAITAYLERTRSRLYDHEQFDLVWAESKRRLRRRIDPMQSARLQYEPAVLETFLEQMGVPEVELSARETAFPFDAEAFLQTQDALHDAFEMADAKRNLLMIRHSMREDARNLRARIEHELER